MSLNTNIRFLGWRLEVDTLATELDENPQLWNEFNMRTHEPHSPHHGLSDIFVRYNAEENYDGDRDAFNRPHLGVWWKSVDRLPSARRLAFQVMEIVEGEHLGMVLITRIPPHTNCKPHQDGGWHATFYDKYAVQIRSSMGQSFCFEEERLNAAPGDTYYFNNAQTHWVENPTDFERITLIVCIRNRFTGVS